jgi:hypothetical protein
MHSSGLYINKYFPFALLYFFFNGVFLPEGMLYTTLLTPFLLIWLIRYPTINYLGYFFLLTIPLGLIHWVNGIEDYAFYVKSYIACFAVFVFGIAFYQYLENCHTLRTIFRKILIINAVMTVLSIVILFFVPPLRTVFWMDNNMSLGGVTVMRLRMLTYEPSYYSTLFAPIVFYYLLKAFRREVPNRWLYYLLTLIPLFLSLSFGVILATAIALFLIFIKNSRQAIFSSKNFRYFAGGLCLLTAITIFVTVFYPDNVVFRRMSNVFSGKDVSFNGRTMDSYDMSLDIAKKKSIAFGVGFGQVKVLGLPVFIKKYNNYRYTYNDIGIPNTTGDTFATLGLVTLALKFFLEIYFFFKTRVYSNQYRLALFLFIFIYQFTGGFLTNIAEYVLWIMAFKADLFPEFNNVKPTLHESPVHSPIDPLQG